MVATDGETVPVAAEKEHMQIGPGKTDAGREWDGAAVNVMRAMTVDEIGKARRTTDSCKSDDFFVIELAFLEDFVKRGENGEIAAAGTPCRVIGGDWLLCLFFPLGGRPLQRGPAGPGGGAAPPGGGGWLLFFSF